MKHGLLFVNLGTPNSPSVRDVRKFLKEFLSDERVIDLPKWSRLALLYGIILPFRPFKTSKGYQKIWDPKKGSPLRYLSESFERQMKEALPNHYIVKLAMRYGEPSIPKVIEMFSGKVAKLTIVPMFPQYASSTTGSTMELCFKTLGKQWNIPHIEYVSHFYDKPWFIESLKTRTAPFLKAFNPCHVLMSFHGLPERQIAKSEKKMCDQSQPCPKIGKDNYFCYRAQCYQTARELSVALGIEDSYCVAFQSRLGRIPWIQPYTDQILHELREKGVRRLSVVCPSFVTDCLETLEEIDIGLQEQWLKMGGEAFQLVPALNDSQPWIQTLSKALLDLS